MIVVELFLEFALLSFVAFGGATALLPELYRVVVEQHHWMDATTFAHMYAIAQAAPGPNVLVVTLIGWQVAGLAGALVATLAMCLPMSVVVYLLFAMAFRMALAIKRKPFFLPFTGLVFAAIALLRWPLPAVMLAGIVLSGAVAYGLLRKDEA